MEDLFIKYITKTKTTFQNEQASIKNLERYVEQIVATLPNKTQVT